MNNSINYEERPDYLKDAFENYFKFAKYNHFQFPFEVFVDAIGGGLSGANFPEINRAKLLQSLIDNCQLIQEAARRTLELRRPLSDREAEEPAPEKEVSHKAFLNIDEVCNTYGLPKSNIKYKAWRDSNGFPYIQTAAKGTVTFKREDVEKWIAEHNTH